MGLTPAELAQRSKLPYARQVDDLFTAARTFTPIATEHLRASVEEYQAMKGTGQFKFRQAGRQANQRLNLLWWERLATTEGCLREKMALFWHGHFAVNSMWSVSTEQYLGILREHALGDLGTLLKTLARSAAMLHYLNNQRNTKEAPNENFAREVMELFTVGRGHYSERDIQEAARAFTGWAFKLESAEFVLRERQHDDGEKTFRGRTGRFTGDDILDMLLEDKRTAQFISRKVYRWFVSPVADEDFVAAMATRFHASHYDISDLMRFVFLSEQFKNSAGQRVKSPIELLCGLDKLFRIRFERPEEAITVQRLLGQVLLRPPSVAGWNEGTGWIDSNSLMLRLRMPASLLNNGSLDWDGPTDGAMTDEMMAMFGQPDAPMRDGKGRVLRTLPDKAAYLAQLPRNATNEDLFSLLLTVDPAPALRDALDKGDPMERTLEILCSPEYQLC